MRLGHEQCRQELTVGRIAFEDCQKSIRDHERLVEFLNRAHELELREAKIEVAGMREKLMAQSDHALDLGQEIFDLKAQVRELNAALVELAGARLRGGPKSEPKEPPSALERMLKGDAAPRTPMHTRRARAAAAELEGMGLTMDDLTAMIGPPPKVVTDGKEQTTQQ